jgi:hypothetical protein
MSGSLFKGFPSAHPHRFFLMAFITGALYTWREMNTDDQQRAAERLKDLIVDQKRSRWPLVIGSILMLAFIGAAAYWFYLPVNERPDLHELKSRLLTKAKSLMNTPVLPPSSGPISNPPAKTAPQTPAGDTGLLSN